MCTEGCLPVSVKEQPGLPSPLVQTSSWVDSLDKIGWILAYPGFTEPRVCRPATWG